MKHSKPKSISFRHVVAVGLATLLVVSLASFVQPSDEAQSATYASGALAFNPKGTNCSTTTPEGGYLSLSPGVGPTDGSSFTLQAVVRSANIAVQPAVVLLGAQGESAKALTIMNWGTDIWKVDLSGRGQLTFKMSGQVMRNGAMTDFVMRNNIWYQLTVIGDTSGISVYVDGDRLVSLSPVETAGGVITQLDGQANDKYKEATDQVTRYKFSDPIDRKSKMVGAWTQNGWCAGGFDLSNLRFVEQALVPSNSTSVVFPETPLQSVTGTSLLINDTTTAGAVSSSDTSNRQAITNLGRYVTATVDANAPSISITTPPTQTVQPGQPVSCEISSTGGAITSYSVDPSPGAGMSFSSTSGVLRGAPTSSGSTTYTITGFNNGGSVSSSCTITVSNSSSGGGFSSGGSGLTVSPPQIKSATSAVYFAPDSALLDKASKKVLRGLVAKLKNSTQLSIRVDGHADSIVGLMPNSKLAATRAKVVAKYLRARVQNATFFVRAFSAKRPAVLGKSTKAYSLNRRSVISATFSQ